MWKKRKERPTIVVPPSLKRLRALDKEIEVRFAHEYPAGLWDVSADFGEFDSDGDFHYQCTPTNVLVFGGDGMDGNHFSSLIVDGRVDETSPVMVTAPWICEYPYDSSTVVAAANFDDFLRLGLVAAFHHLSYLAESPERTLLQIAEWGTQESIDPHGVRMRAILKFIADELELEPRCPTFEEFQALQDRYKPLLKFPNR